ncbi:PREDICTED: uncharacterized protein LOC109216863 [Nicotiana attenuata]|uniref:uncharacterized protein LOC109216863 n=1 Tax=Nicotiana attenuata TaxID=49451 RepID=UPI000905BC9A|nr:PREDICTED: uncharacterized protein LOC109216863 [Nicotiana attenuata]
MRIALQAKRKLGFVTGACVKESFPVALHEDWETCNAIVLSWIMNTVSPHLLSGVVYASNAHLVWKDLQERFDKYEFDAMAPTPSCGCEKSKDYVEHLHQQRLLQFLGGLNDSYAQARRQILMKTTEPTLNQAYALIIEDETQR